MFGTYFYNETIKRSISIFGTLFNEIVINRTDNNGNRVQDIKVPLAYGPRDKTIARLEQDPDLDREAAIVLPRMSFEMIGMSYATERKLNTVRRNVAIHDSNNNSNLRTMYNPVPYDINIELNILILVILVKLVILVMLVILIILVNLLLLVKLVIPVKLVILMKLVKNWLFW